MSRDTTRYLVAILILAAGIIGVHLLARGSSIGLPNGVQTPNSALRRYIVDLDTWRATNRQMEALSPYDFTLSPALNKIPLQLGDWVGQDIPERNKEVYLLLEPEQYVKRLYELKNDPEKRYIWLFLIGSRQLKSFHHPDICYTAIDWQTTVGSEIIPLDEGELYALRIVARNSKEQQLSFYFFVFPDDSFDESKGVVMLRTASPVWGSETETIALQKNFIQQLFTAAGPN